MGTLQQFETYLTGEEKGALTVVKYLRDVQYFLGWLGERELSKSSLLAFKAQLLEGYAVSSLRLRPHFQMHCECSCLPMLYMDM